MLFRSKPKVKSPERKTYTNRPISGERYVPASVRGQIRILRVEISGVDERPYGRRALVEIQVRNHPLQVRNHPLRFSGRISGTVSRTTSCGDTNRIAMKFCIRWRGFRRGIREKNFWRTNFEVNIYHIFAKKLFLDFTT